MMHRLAALVLLVLAGGAACREATDEPASPGCQVLHDSGEYEGVGRYDDTEQPYWIVIPAGYEGMAPAPLFIHLASGAGDHNAVLEHWRPYLDDVPGLAVIVNTASGRGQADAVASLVDQIKDEYCVDSQRVHVTGTATSFFKAENFACEHSDRVASFVAALGGGVGVCEPDRPVPLLTFTGDADRSGVDRLVDKWIDINGCDPEPVVEELGSGVRRKAYQDCAADILLYDIEGMGHTLPVHEAKGPAAGFMTEYDEVDYMEEAYKFFADHPLP